MKDVQQEMQQLTEQLLYHARRYYNEDAPEISDFEYDKKLSKRLFRHNNSWFYRDFSVYRRTLINEQNS